MHVSRFRSQGLLWENVGAPSRILLPRDPILTGSGWKCASRSSDGRQTWFISLPFIYRGSDPGRRKRKIYEKG
jgi:hypothetical protein